MSLKFIIWYSQNGHYVKCQILYQFSNNLEWNQNWSLVLSAMESFNHNFRILNKIFNILLFNKKCKFQIWLLKNWFIVALHARVEKIFSAQLYFVSFEKWQYEGVFSLSNSYLIVCHFHEEVVLTVKLVWCGSQVLSAQIHSATTRQTLKHFIL